jgi:hypothetical protein
VSILAPDSACRAVIHLSYLITEEEQSALGAESPYGNVTKTITYVQAAAGNKHPARHGRRAWVPFGLLLIAVSSYLNKEQPTTADKA